MADDNKRKRGRPPKGTRRGRPLTIYMSQPREELFEKAFELMCEQGILPSTANVNQSRTEVIDHALDALIAKLKKKSD
ncbi:MAG: hypothetical protein AAFQ07_10360, partial [Chloroflexota bacterium]